MISSNTNVNKLKQITSHISKLPTLPIVASKLVSMIEDPNVSAKEISELIAIDQALTAKLLKLVNSAYYGFPRKISTISHAVVILGFNTLRDLVLSASLFDVFEKKGDIPGFSRAEFWKHTLGTAICARMLAKEFHFRIVGEAFVAGLLHDIGKLIIDSYFHDFFVEIINYKDLKSIPLMQAEKMILGVNHADIGQWLADEWKLPKPVVEAIAYHHTPERAELEVELVYVVYMANIIVKMSKIGYSGDWFYPETFHPQVVDYLKSKKYDLDEVDINNFITNLKREIKNASEFFEMVK